MSKIVVKISDMRACANPDNTLITFALGSCLGLILFDPQLRVGGLLHALLPEGKNKKQISTDFNPFKYVDTGVPLLYKECYRLGATKRSLKAYAFGCASIEGAANVMHIGERNAAALKKILWKNNVLLEREHLGGKISRTVQIQLSSGLISLKEHSSVIEIDAGQK